MALYQIVFGHTATGAGQTYSLGEASPTTRGGLTFGFSADLTGNARDRAASYPPELRGCVFAVNASGERTFSVTMPEGAGDYEIGAAFGDAGSEQEIRAQVRDGLGGTLLQSISGTTGSSSHTGSASWFDATATLRQGVPEVGQPGYATSWPFTSALQTMTFSGSVLAVHMAVSSASFSTALAFLRFEKVGGGGGATRATPFGHRGTAFNGGKTFLGSLRREAMGQACAVGDRIAAAVQREREAFGQRLLAGI